MATLLLPALVAQLGATAAAGAGITGAVSLHAATSLGLTLAGGLLDSQFILPKLFGAESDADPRLGDVQFSAGQEGANRNHAFGKTVRVPCHPVFISELREVKDTSSGGGKGGSGGEFVTYRYHVDAVLEIAKGRISRVLKLWADGKLFFDAQPDIAPPGSTQITATVLSPQLFNPVATNQLVLESDMGAGGPDLSLIQSGEDATVAGYPAGSPGVTDGTFNTAKGKGSGSIPVFSTLGGTINKDDVLVVDGHNTLYRATETETIGAGNVKDVNIAPGLAAFVQAGTAIEEVRVADDRNNGTWLVVSSSKDEVADTSQVKLTNPLDQEWSFQPDTAGDSITVSQEQPTHKESQVGAIRFGLGPDGQEADETLVALKGNESLGDANVYGQNRRARIVLEDFDLFDFGNRLPNIEALIEVDGADDELATVIKAIAVDRHGYSENEIDVSAVSSASVGGYNLKGPASGKVDLAPLLLAYDVIVREDGPKLVFESRANVASLDLAQADLAAHEPGGDMPGLMDVNDQAELRVPTEVVVSFIDATKDYQQSTRRSRLTEPVGVHVQRVDLPLVIDGDLAQQIADRLLAVAHATRRALTLRLGPSKLGQVREGMILKPKSIYGDDWEMLAATVDRGANFLIRVEGREEDSSVYTQTATGEGVT